METIGEMIKVSNNSSKEDIEKLYALNVGDVFRITEGFEGVMLLIDMWCPQGRDFEVYPITPGTDLYTIYGAGHCVVTRNSQG